MLPWGCQFEATFDGHDRSFPSTLRSVTAPLLPAHPELEGRVVVVTGGARGMGRAYVEGFLGAKAKVVALDKTWAGDEDFRVKLTKNPDAMALDMDVTQDADIDRAYKEVL